MDNPKYSIYKHTTPDGKIYIGITSVNPEKRWGVNGINYNKQYFYEAIKEFGWDNIKHEIIATNIDRVYAECFEKALIKMYDSTNKENGYNVSDGGLDVEINRFFVYYYDFKLDLSPQYITRLFMMCSYIAYDTNYLRYSNGTYLNSKSLKAILKLSDVSYKNFIRDITSKGYLIKESGKFKINDNIVSKGKIYSGRNYIKVYGECFISLYNSINSRQHKLLGYLISEIQNLNIKYNVLCNNIHEKDFDMIDSIEFKNVLKKFNLSTVNLKRFKDDINKIKFIIDNEDQSIIKYYNDKKYMIYNPKVFYNGNNVDRDSAYIFFKSISSND